MHPRILWTPWAALVLTALVACGAGGATSAGLDGGRDAGLQPDLVVIGDVGGAVDATAVFDGTPDHPRPLDAAEGPDTSSDLRTALAALVAPYVSADGEEDKARALVVGLSTPEHRLVVGFGRVGEGSGEAPTGAHLFEIGSVSKVVTGYLLARALQEGEVTLDDEIDAWFPDGAPRFMGQGISLLDLATHTSGLPRMPDNLPAPGTANPAAGYELTDLAAFLVSYVLTVEPGVAFLYSNLGAGLLGFVLARAAASESWEALVQARVAGPLGLPDTIVTLSSA